jgi:hypothetical protein
MTPLAERDRLDAAIRLERECMHLYRELCLLRFARAMALMQCHARGRCAGVYDLMLATQVLQAAHDAGHQAIAAASRLSKWLDTRRGDGLNTLEYETLRELHEARESAGDTVR